VAILVSLAPFAALGQEGSSVGTDDGFIPAEALDPAPEPWRAYEEVELPPARLDEDPDMLVRVPREAPPEEPAWWTVQTWGAGSLGTQISRAGGVNLLLGFRMGVARWDHRTRRDDPSLEQVARWFPSWGLVDARLEAGVSDESALPWMELHMAARRHPLREQREGGVVTLRTQRSFGLVNVERNVRVQRPVRFEVSAAEYALHTEVAERTNVSTLISLGAQLPGYAHVGRQGRADPFHGLQLTRVWLEAGPRFGPSSAPYVRYVLGGAASTAIGAQTGPTATFRSDVRAWTGLDILPHAQMHLGLRMAWDAARDSYRDATDSAWRVSVEAGGRF
jgi:hypothetical protein